jgi:DNA-binding MarR family transcriptional regulator
MSPSRSITTEDQGAWPGGSPASYVGWTLIQASHALSRHVEALLATVGLTPMQFGVLVQLSLQPNLGSGQLARLVLVTPQSMGELIQSLERAGWVERDQGVGPGRRIGVRITAAGRAVLRRATPIVQALDVPETLGLTAQEATTLNELLHKVRGTVRTSGFRRQLTARIDAHGEARPRAPRRPAEATG